MQHDLWSMAFVFMLATFVGFQVIQNVSRLLHTPLMSLTNAISAIAVVGSILVAGQQHTTFATISAHRVAARCHIVSGFMITDRIGGCSVNGTQGRTTLTQASTCWPRSCHPALRCQPLTARSGVAPA